MAQFAYQLSGCDLYIQTATPVWVRVRNERDAQRYIRTHRIPIWIRTPTAYLCLPAYRKQGGFAIHNHIHATDRVGTWLLRDVYTLTHIATGYSIPVGQDTCYTMQTRLEHLLEAIPDAAERLYDPVGVAIIVEAAKGGSHD